MTISLRRPKPERLAVLRAALADRPLSYAPGLLDRIDQISATPTSLSGARGGGWFVDRFGEVVGHGDADFAAACDALRAWAMFDQAWTVTASPPTPIEPDATVTYAARVLGLWWSYGCHIIDVIDEPRRFGFVYGTIAGHAEKGEERFQVRQLDNDDIEFSLVAVTRPGRWFAWPGLPISRRAQRRFRPGAAAGIRRAMRTAGV